MGFNLLFDAIRILGIVADDILEMEEVLGVNTGKFQADQAINASYHLTVYLNARPHARQKDGEKAGGTLGQHLLQLQQTAADTEIGNALDHKFPVADSKSCPDIKANSTKPPFFRGHIPAPLKNLGLARPALPFVDIPKLTPHGYQLFSTTPLNYSERET